MTLPNVQAELAEALFLKDGATDLLQPSNHVEIYRNNIFSALVDCLKDTYPIIQKLLGDDFFAMTAKEYIRCYPSRSGNLHDYGEYFGDFLAEYQPVHHLIYLAEVAEFEWACHRIYLAADSVEFNIDSLKQYTPMQYENLRFTLNPASHLHQYHFPILQIVDLCLTNPDETVDLHQEGTNLLILRSQFDLSLITLSHEDLTFLQALNENHTFLHAFHLAQNLNQSYNLEERLPEFIQNKIIVDCYFSNEQELI